MGVVVSLLLERNYGFSNCQIIIISKYHSKDNEENIIVMKKPFHLFLCRCKTWLQNIRRNDLRDVEVSKLAKLSVCSDHFESSMFCDPNDIERSIRLPNSYPTKMLHLTFASGDHVPMYVVSTSVRANVSASQCFLSSNNYANVSNTVSLPFMSTSVRAGVSASQCFSSPNNSSNHVPIAFADSSVSLKRKVSAYVVYIVCDSYN
jgi:hypothetical protein